jgi:uncharacterized membrane protein
MNKTLRKLLDYVLIGVVGFLPILIIFQIVVYVERLLRHFILLVHGRYENPLITAALFVTSIVLLGYFGYLLKQDKAHMLYYLESFIGRIPIIGTIYRVTKKLFRMFLSGEGTSIREVVYVEYPKEGLWVPAYVTNRIKNIFVLYVPTSPNPTSGFTVIVDESKIVRSKMDLEQVSSFIISMGVDFPGVEEASSLTQRRIN